MELAVTFNPQGAVRTVSFLRPPLSAYCGGGDRPNNWNEPRGMNSADSSTRTPGRALPGTAAADENRHAAPRSAASGKRKTERRFIHNVPSGFISLYSVMKRNRMVSPGTGPQETAP